MQLTILTPEKEVFTGEIISVKVPGASGEFEVLKNHAPIISALVNGRVRVIKASGEKLNYLINSGFIEVLNNSVSLLVQGLQVRTK